MDDELVTVRDNTRGDGSRWWHDLPRPSPAALIGVLVLVLIAWAAIHLSSQGDAVPFEDAPGQADAEDSGADPTAGGVAEQDLAASEDAAAEDAAVDDAGSEEPVSDDQVAAGSSGSSGGTPSEVTVHVSGAVEDPGVVQLPGGARVVDALEASGGTTEDADPAALNLARELADGEQIHVPTPGEETLPEHDTPADGAADEPAAGGQAGGGGQVDINTASATELEELPGVGPAIAGRIIDHRELNGPFTSVDDLLDVSGIGPKTLENIRPQATV